MFLAMFAFSTHDEQTDGNSGIHVAQDPNAGFKVKANLGGLNTKSRTGVNTPLDDGIEDWKTNGYPRKASCSIL